MNDQRFFASLRMTAVLFEYLITCGLVARDVIHVMTQL